ncbi:hypothetical protein ABIF66_001585 [Bradyrhizobium japonicum]
MINRLQSPRQTFASGTRTSLTDRLYQLPNLLRPIVTGDNKDTTGLGYNAGPGWNACTGLGSPDGGAIVTALTTVA